MSWRARLQSWAELGQRYRTVLRHFWQQRHAAPVDFFNHDEAEFLPAGLALQQAPSSATLRWTGRVLMALVLFVLLWSVLGHMDIVVNASGKVIPSARTKTIASIDVASVRALYVTEGQQVRAGDVLIELDSSSSDAEHDKAADSEAQARLQVARSLAMANAVEVLRPPMLPPVAGSTAAQWQAARQQLADQYRDFQARLRRLDGEITRYAGLLALASQQAEDYRALLPGNTVSRHAWLEKERIRTDLSGQLLDASNQRAALIAQTRKEARDALLEGEKIVAASEEDRRRAGQHSKLLRLQAPVDGTVQQLSVHTVGGVVPAAQPLMQIVPQEEQVEVEAFLENRDVGFVRVDQAAAVKIDTFEYTRYGTVAGVVKDVSRDAIENEKKGLIYSTRVALEKSSIVVDGKTVLLSPGMAVNVEIKTGDRRVIQYVLSPLMQHVREALNER